MEAITKLFCGLVSEFTRGEPEAVTGEKGTDLILF